MTQRPDRQPEDVDSPMHPAADPDLEDGTEVSESRTDNDGADNDGADNDESATDGRRD